MTRHLQRAVRRVMFSGFLLILTAGSSRAATIFVTTAGSDNNDGQSWATAKRTVQAGLNTSVADDQVWVAAGTYVENITLKAAVKLYGGFAGTEDLAAFDLGNRDLIANPTILDGNKTRTVVTSPPAATQTTRIDGFTIRNGRGRTFPFGGGVDCSSSSPTIINCTISGNTAILGGGVFWSLSSPTILNCTITQNVASSKGGGICCQNSSASIIANCAIFDNSAYGGYGGGVSCDYSAPTIVNCTINRNLASFGGGLHLSNLVPRISNSTITGNLASATAGGIFCSSSSPIITNTILAFNNSGIWISGANTPVLQYNCVYGNSAYNYSNIADPSGTDGNISVDPRFVRNPSVSWPGAQGSTSGNDYGDLRLLPTSPCLDAGDNTSVPTDTTDLDHDGNTTEPTPIDLLGAPRFADVWTADTGIGTPPIVDMGAYELPAGLYLLGAVSRKQHPSAFDIDLNPLYPASPAAVECRMGGPTSLLLSFSGPADGLSVSASAGTVNSVAVNGQQATVELADLPDHTCLALTLSGIGDLKGTTELHVRYQAGDVDGDGNTNIFDLVKVRNSLNQATQASTFRNDVTADGTIDIFDLVQIRNVLNTSAAPCP